jgi:hypothetical protein
MMKKWGTPILVVFLVLGLVVGFTFAVSFTKRFEEHSGNTLLGNAMSPSRNADFSNIWIRVTSKCNMARSSGTSPHVGTDMTMAKWTRVFPAFDGKVVRVNHDLSKQMGCVVLDHDIDDNGTYDGYYFMYRHIDPDNEVSIGDIINVDESFGRIDERRPEGYTPHLHYGWTDDTQGYIANSTSRFYVDESIYWYGRDFDFFARDYWTHNTLYINAYSKEGDTRQNSTEVDVYCKVGSGAWSDVPKHMTLNSSSSYHQWQFDFGSIAGVSTGTVIQFYLVGYRNLTGYDNWSLWPQYYQHPPVLPSAFGDPPNEEVQYVTKTIVDDHGNTMGTATPVYVGSRAGVISYQNDIDVFRFSPPTSRSYTFRTIGSTDTFGTLYDSDSEVLDYDDNSGEGSNFQFSETLFYGQVYYVYVQHYSPYQTGAYTFWID